MEGLSLKGRQCMNSPLTVADDVVTKGHSNKISVNALSVKGQLRHRSNVTGKYMNGDEKGHESTRSPIFPSANYSQGNKFKA